MPLVRTLQRSAVVSRFRLIPYLLLLGLVDPSLSHAMAGYQYVSPAPGSDWVSRGNNVAVRQGSAIDPQTLRSDLFMVVGSKSGAHAGSCVLADDVRTLVFTPHTPYSPGETVAVTMAPGARTSRGRPLPPLAFSFSVAPSDPPPHPFGAEAFGQEPTLARSFERGRPAKPVLASPGDEVSDLPAGFPPIIPMALDNPEPGCVFITPRTNDILGPLVIIDNHGMPIFYRRSPRSFSDFKLQPTGLLTYYDLGARKFFGLDSTYAVVDTFDMGNGYSADVHDMQLLPNNHILLFAYEARVVRMDTVVVGGNPNAVVVGLVLQELDSERNVVFQWRSWDHFKITDAVHINLTAPFIDYVHCNAVEMDTDGNLLISSRHLSEITKIDRQTGDVLWRWGLNAINNQFTHVGDTRGFSWQHDIRRAPNGHVTLFDNGSFLNPQYSRGLEYELDEQNKIATLVWEYPLTPQGWANSAGSVQRRASGNVMIGWGAGSVAADVTDLHPDGSKAFEITYYPPGMTSYRAFRFNWRATLIETGRDSLDFGDVLFGDVRALPLAITNNGTEDLEITSFVTSDAAFSVTEAAPMTIGSGASSVVYVAFRPEAQGERLARLYVRAANDTQLVAQDVQLRGVGMVQNVPAVPPAMLAPFVLIMAGSGAMLLSRRGGRGY